MNFIHWLLLTSFFTIDTVKSQSAARFDSLAFWGDAMISMQSDEFKEMARVNFEDCFYREIVSINDSIKLRFHPGIVRIQSADKKLSIYSWKIDFKEKESKYTLCVFQTDKAPLLIHSNSRNLYRINYEEMGSDNWYGALYYFILPERFNDCYLLLGFASLKDGSKHKFIEPLSIDNGNIRFGKKLFLKHSENGTEDWYHRIALHYSAAANVAINYETDQNQIIFDHISQFNDPRTGESLNVPDGTIEAFTWEGSFWKHNPYLKNEILDSAPLEKPILGKSSPGLDLFGKPKKQ